MPEKRFPYEKSQWRNRDNEEAWLKELETLGPENVRMVLLARSTIASSADISIGRLAMTKGFAQEWLGWRDRQKADQEAKFHTKQIYWTRWAAWAATAAVLITASGWALTLLLK
jgi:hypothetical protein